jgi:hypothetical protein
MLLKHFDSPIPITYQNMVIVHFSNGNPGSVTWGHTSTNNKNDRWYFRYLSLHCPLQEFSTDWYFKYGILYYIIWYICLWLNCYIIYIIFNIILSHIVCICIGLSPPTLVPRTSRTHLPIPSRSGQPIAKRPAQKDVFNLTRSSTLAGTVHM